MTEPSELRKGSGSWASAREVCHDLEHAEHVRLLDFLPTSVSDDARSAAFIDGSRPLMRG